MSKSGKLRALVTTLNERSPLLPDVPTIHEAGVPTYTISNWMGLVGPARLPREIVARLNEEFAVVLRKQEVIDGAGQAGVHPRTRRRRKPSAPSSASRSSRTALSCGRPACSRTSATRPVCSACL